MVVLSELSERGREIDSQCLPPSRSAFIDVTFNPSQHGYLSGVPKQAKGSSTANRERSPGRNGMQERRWLARSCMNPYARTTLLRRLTARTSVPLEPLNEPTSTSKRRHSVHLDCPSLKAFEQQELSEPGKMIPAQPRINKASCCNTRGHGARAVLEPVLSLHVDRLNCFGCRYPFSTPVQESRDWWQATHRPTAPVSQEKSSCL